MGGAILYDFKFGDVIGKEAELLPPLWQIAKKQTLFLAQVSSIFFKRQMMMLAGKACYFLFFLGLFDLLTIFLTCFFFSCVGVFEHSL